MYAAVSKWGNSLAVRLPKTITEDAKLQEGTEITIMIERDMVVMRKAKPRYTLAELVEQTKPEHRHGELDKGGPVGREEI